MIRAVVLLAVLLAGCSTAPPRVVYVQTPCSEKSPEPAETPLQNMRGVLPVPGIDAVLRAALIELENRSAREILLEAALSRCRL